MTKKLLPLKGALSFLAIMLFSGGLQAATLFENFDNPSAASTTHTAKDITYTSGTWSVCGVTKSNPPKEDDRLIGDNSIRLWGRTAGQTSLAMKFNKSGAGVVSVNYGSYGNHTGGRFKIQQSINDGGSWTDVGPEITVPAWIGTFLTHYVPVNYNGNIRFRIEMTATTGANEKINVDNFMVTDFGTTQVAMPTSSVPTGVYETAQTVTLSSETAGATIYYTTDGTAPTATSNVYSTPLNITQTTKIRMIAVASGKVDSREEVVIVNVPISINTLSEFYNLIPSSGTNLQYYKYTGEATISYVYWATTTNTAKKIVLQDNTAGIFIDDNSKILTTEYAIGDKVTGIIGQVANLNSAPVFYPNSNFTVLSSNNSLVAKAIKLADVTTNVYQLIQLNDLYFPAADGTAKFAVNSFRSIYEIVGSAPSDIGYNTPSSIAVSPNYIGTVLPSKTNIIALIMRNNPTNSTINSGTPYYYLFPRMTSEIGVDFKPTGIQKPSVLPIYIANGKVHFETTKSERVIVYTISGQQVRNLQSTIGKNSIALPKGIYTIRIGSELTKVIL